MDHIKDQNQIIMNTMERLGHRPVNELEMEPFNLLISSSHERIEMIMFGVSDQIAALDKRFCAFIDYFKSSTGLKYYYYV
jgi:hypothetical protein